MTRLLFLSSLLCLFGEQGSAEENHAGSRQVLELNQPRLSLRLGGEMGRRIQANLERWLYPCPR